MSEFSWVATDALTGNLIADLPDLNVSSVKKTLGRYESATGDLPLPTAPVDWVRATTPGAANLHLLSQAVDAFGNHIGDPVPVWGGMVTQQTLSEGDVVPLSMATIESYFDRRYVGDESYVNVGQNDIINDLINKYVKVGANGGIPIRVQYTGAGKLRTIAYKNQDDKTVYSVLTDFMGMEGGPEWSAGWELLHNPERITPVLYLGDRVGAPVTAGLGPAATFEMPGPVNKFQMVRDYSNGKGATSVTATSSGQGTLRPQSLPQTTTDPTRPTFEHRFSPSTSITETATLTSYALSALTALNQGSVALAISATASAKGCPQLGVDWFIGDDIGYHIGGLVPDPRTRTAYDIFTDIFSDTFGSTGTVLINPLGVESVPAFPGGISGVGRCIGWELSLGATPVYTPILAGTDIN